MKMRNPIRIKHLLKWKNRNVANFTNKSFYTFHLNRNIKKELKQNIKEGIVDSFMI